VANKSIGRAIKASRGHAVDESGTKEKLTTAPSGLPRRSPTLIFTTQNFPLAARVCYHHNTCPWQHPVPDLICNHFGEPNGSDVICGTEKQEVKWSAQLISSHLPANANGSFTRGGP